MGFVEVQRSGEQVRVHEPASRPGGRGGRPGPVPAPGQINSLPHALGLFAAAPDHIEQQLLAALDMHAIYRRDLRQATIVLTLTDTTVARLAADPHRQRHRSRRTRHSRRGRRHPATSGNACADVTPAAI
jgi:hypothetical protein